MKKVTDMFQRLKTRACGLSELGVEDLILQPGPKLKKYIDNLPDTNYTIKM